MTAAIDRRHFLGTTAAAGMAAGLAGSGDAAGTQGAGANNRLVVGIMGTGGRGTGLATPFQQPQSYPGLPITSFPSRF